MLAGRAPLILRRTFNGARPRMRRSLLTASYVEGPSEPPLSFDTIPEHFQTHILPRYASRPALICTSERPRPHGGPTSHNLGIKTHLSWDYEEFDRHVLALAKGLLRMGVEKGSRVGVVMGNCSCVQWSLFTIAVCIDFGKQCILSSSDRYCKDWGDISSAEPSL
jgi:hypothetical protein